MPFASTDRDVDIHYRLAGDGPRVVNISGSGADMRAPSLLRDELERHCSVLSYDQRGLGQSSKPDRPYTMADYARDAMRLMDALGWSSARVVGVSFGGMVAQELAVTEPDAVERLALICTSPGGDGGSSYPLHELPDLPPDELAWFRLELSDRRRDAAWRTAHPDTLERILTETARIRSIGADEPGHDAGARRQLEARAHHDVWDRIDQLSMPTLVMGGHHDGTAPPENQSAMAGRIPDAELRMYDGGHMFLIQDRRAIPDAVDFLSR